MRVNRWSSAVRESRTGTHLRRRQGGTPVPSEEEEEKFMLNLTPSPGQGVFRPHQIGTLPQLRSRRLEEEEGLYGRGRGGGRRREEKENEEEEEEGGRGR